MCCLYSLHSFYIVSFDCVIKISIQQQQHLFNDPLSGTTQMRQYQKGKTNLDLLEHGPYAYLHLDPKHNHASIPPLRSQRQSTEGKVLNTHTDLSYINV